MSELKTHDVFNLELIKKLNATLPINKRLWREDIIVTYLFFGPTFLG